jgi:hypothetical protein
LERGGTSVTLEQFIPEGDNLRVAVVVTGPVSGQEAALMAAGSGTAAACLVTPDGSRVNATGTAMRSDGREFRYEYTFRTPPELRSIVFSRMDRGEPTVLVPFVIPNIPIPG